MHSNDPDNDSDDATHTFGVPAVVVSQSTSDTVHILWHASDDPRGTGFAYSDVQVSLDKNGDDLVWDGSSADARLLAAAILRACDEAEEAARG